MSSVSYFPETKPFRWLHGDGRPVASVRFTPEELERRNGVVFSRSSDDLDTLSFAAYSPTNQLIRDGDMTPALLVLIRYDGDPDPGTTVYADVELSVEQAYALTHSLLNVTNSDFTWLTEYDVSDVARVGD